MTLDELINAIQYYANVQITLYNTTCKDLTNDPSIIKKKTVFLKTFNNVSSSMQLRKSSHTTSLIFFHSMQESVFPVCVYKRN